MRGRLGIAVTRIEDRMTADQAGYIRELIAADEWGLALEQIADVLSEHEAGLRDDERDQLLALNRRMGMGDRVPGALSLCPRIS